MQSSFETLWSHVMRKLFSSTATETMAAPQITMDWKKSQGYWCHSYHACIAHMWHVFVEMLGSANLRSVSHNKKGKVIHLGGWEMNLQLRAPTALAEDHGSASITHDSCLLTPEPEDIMPSSGVHRQAKHEYIQKWIKLKSTQAHLLGAVELIINHFKKASSKASPSPPSQKRFLVSRGTPS